jgi:molecular chaperone HscA
VVQGERELVADCRSLARFKLTGIPPMPAGLARLEVTFLVNADGILQVSAREETTGKETSIQVKPSYGLTDEEVERMLLDSFTHGAEDVKARLLTEQRVEADRILAATHAAMTDSPELLTDADRAAIAGAERALAAAKAGTDHLAIRAGVEALDAASKPFAQRRMDRALETGLRGRALDEVESKVNETAHEAGHEHSHAGRR